MSDRPSPDDTSMEIRRLGQLVGTPKFQEGYRDGEAGRPPAHFSEAYRAGYHEGKKTAAIGTPESRWPVAFAKG